MTQTEADNWITFDPRRHTFRDMDVIEVNLDNGEPGGRVVAARVIARPGARPVINVGGEEYVQGVHWHKFREPKRGTKVLD